MLAASPSVACSRLNGDAPKQRCVVARAEAAPLSRRAALAAATAVVLARTPASLAAPAFGAARLCPRPPFAPHSRCHPPCALAEAGDGADVSAYLPEASEDANFVSFVPGPSKTPALRSGVIDPAAPYRFNLPKAGRWKEAKVANAISGNVRALAAATEGSATHAVTHASLCARSVLPAALR